MISEEEGATTDSEGTNDDEENEDRNVKLRGKLKIKDKKEKTTKAAEERKV